MNEYLHTDTARICARFKGVVLLCYEHVFSVNGLRLYNLFSSLRTIQRAAQYTPAFTHAKAHSHTNGGASMQSDIQLIRNTHTHTLTHTQMEETLVAVGVQ